MVAGLPPFRWLLDDPAVSLRAHASTGDGVAAVERACGMWEYSEVLYPPLTRWHLLLSTDDSRVCYLLLATHDLLLTLTI